MSDRQKFIDHIEDHKQDIDHRNNDYSYCAVELVFDVVNRDLVNCLSQFLSSVGAAFLNIHNMTVH